VDSNEPTDLKDKENELALEQAKMERIRMELELEKIKQDSAPPKPKERSGCDEGSVPHSKPPPFLLFCLTFLPPIGIIWLWRLKVPIFAKVIFTLYSLFMFSILIGWIYLPHEPWHMFFLFTGQ